MTSPNFDPFWKWTILSDLGSVVKDRQNAILCAKFAWKGYLLHFFVKNKLYQILSKRYIWTHIRCQICYFKWFLLNKKARGCSKLCFTHKDQSGHLNFELSFYSFFKKIFLKIINYHCKLKFFWKKKIKKFFWKKTDLWIGSWHKPKNDDTS